MNDYARFASGVGVGLLTIAAAVGAVGSAGPGSPAEEPVLSAALGIEAHSRIFQEPGYEGPRAGCRKCHLREYRSWQRTPHADAFEALAEDERTDPECLRCHATGWGAPTGFKSIEETPQLAGVTCEVCHGPGSMYKDEEVMRDHDASVAAGMLVPDEQTCRGCHNPESRTFPGTFEYAEMRENGVHTIRER